MRLSSWAPLWRAVYADAHMVALLFTIAAILWMGGVI